MKRQRKDLKEKHQTDHGCYCYKERKGRSLRFYLHFLKFFKNQKFIHYMCVNKNYSEIHNYINMFEP